jgi:hypothetical protein
MLRAEEYAEARPARQKSAAGDLAAIRAVLADG